MSFVPRLARRSAITLASRVACRRPLQGALAPLSTLLRNPSQPIATRLQSTQAPNTAQIKVDKPQLMIAFTCKKCDTRSSHVMSKQAYTKGTVLITCPGCKNRHLIADHLKIFSDNKITIEDILGAKGESVSQTTDDLAFDDIPESLKKLIGHHAKDAPDHVVKEAEGGEEQKILPDGAKK